MNCDKKSSYRCHWLSRRKQLLEKIHFEATCPIHLSQLPQKNSCQPLQFWKKGWQVFFQGKWLICATIILSTRFICSVLARRVDRFQWLTEATWYCRDTAPIHVIWVAAAHRDTKCLVSRLNLILLDDWNSKNKASAFSKNMKASFFCTIWRILTKYWLHDENVWLPIQFGFFSLTPTSRKLLQNYLGDFLRIFFIWTISRQKLFYNFN